MRNLLGWYKAHIGKKDFKHFILLDVREEQYFKRYLLHIPLDELFQIFNQRELDKSTISCYCL
jgi:rhodanese-related sulfurtransferase